MSVSIMVPVKAGKLDQDKLLQTLASKGYELVVIGKLASGHLRLHINNVSTRPIDIMYDDNRAGYEIRITTLASPEDYCLFAQTVDEMIKVLESKGMYEADEDDVFQDAMMRLDRAWQTEQMEIDYRVLCSMIYQAYDEGEDSEIGLMGVRNMYQVGVRLFDDLGIDRDTPFEVGYPKLLERFRYTQYVYGDNIRITPNNLVFQGEDGQEKKVSIYSKGMYDLIIKSHFLGIVLSESDVLVLDYDDFMSIAPLNWERIDNSQYLAKPLDDVDWECFVEKARCYSRS